MGREVKRVAIEFDWPLKATWHGYLSWFRPPKCGACEGSGWCPAAKAEYDRLSETRQYGDRLYTAVTDQFPDRSWACQWCGGKGSVLPTDPAVLAALAPWVNKWDDYSFPKTEPPVGDGWQLWETTSEGSPVTPVFATAEELARWCDDHQFDTPPNRGTLGPIDGKQWNYLAGGTGELSYERWLKFIVGPGWAPSMAVDSGGVRSGVEFATEEKTS